MISILFTAQANAQQESYYRAAINIMQEQLNNPDLTAEDRAAIKEAIVETQNILNELKSDAPYIDSSESQYQDNNSTNIQNTAPKVPEPVKNNNVRGKYDCKGCAAPAN